VSLGALVPELLRINFLGSHRLETLIRVKMSVTGAPSI
jgi:hypothetical protein